MEPVLPKVHELGLVRVEPGDVGLQAVEPTLNGRGRARSGVDRKKSLRRTAVTAPRAQLARTITISARSRAMRALLNLSQAGGRQAYLCVGEHCICGRQRFQDSAHHRRQDERA